MKLVLRQLCSRLIEEVIIVAFKKRSSQIRLAFLNTELLIRFHCSDENNASDFSEAF